MRRRCPTRVRAGPLARGVVLSREADEPKSATESGVEYTLANASKRVKRSTCAKTPGIASGATPWRTAAVAVGSMTARVAGTYAAVAAAMYRRFHRQIRAHPRHRVKLALYEETRFAFERPAAGDTASRARDMSRAVLALTWLRRAAANATSTEGELLYTLMGQRDSVLRRRRAERLKPQKAKLRATSGTGDAETRLLRAAYGPLVDLIGVRGVAGENWTQE